MTDEDLDTFVTAAVSELEQKQEVLTSKWGLGTFQRYLFDQPTASLQFFDAADRAVLWASVVPIGSYSARSETWKWSWSNDSFLAPLRDEASKLRALTEITGLPVFDMPGFAAEPEMVGDLAAMSVKHLDALGCYRAPGANSDLYLAIMDIGPAGAQ